MRHSLLILLSLFLFNCTSQQNKVEGSSLTLSSRFRAIDTNENQLHLRFPTPENFERVALDSTSFGFYLRTLPLKKHGSLVKFFDGKIKDKKNVYCAVIDQDIDPLNLQQCADAVMRLRGEYLFAQKKYSDIHFNYVSDQKPHYFKSFANGDYTYKNFRKYMKQVFNFANTSSLKNELKKVENFDNLQVGDVLIQSGSPYGHAVIVVDVALHMEAGQKAFLLAQSYMPAQETQLLINPSDPSLSPWYCPSSNEIRTPEWTFVKGDLRRFDFDFD